MHRNTNILKCQKGFTLIEMVLYVVVSGLILATASQLLLSQVESFSFMTSRQTVVADTRYALNRITGELILIETDDISSIASDEIQFTDSTASATSFRSNTSGDDLALFRGDEMLLDSIESFDLKYYDANDNELFSDEEINDIRRVEVTITTKEKADEGSITLTTMVIPRNFLYSGYQS
jgi:prepilin-type N-terminal cleavage/methylation domain-containing protein